MDGAALGWPGAFPCRARRNRRSLGRLPGSCMAEGSTRPFLAGVIEGFYGAPWSVPERLDLVASLASWGFNAYLYGPKDDLHHRVDWRTPYSGADAAELARFAAACAARGIDFLYALGPGLDIRHSDPADLAALEGRFAQLLSLGCRGIALLFDDIPDTLDPADRARWGSLAAAQSAVANAMHGWLAAHAPDVRLLFCPTPYCGRMDAAGHGGPQYLDAVGALLHPDIDVFWTGPEIVSREITVEHVQSVARRLRRPPVIWDNLHANDYDGRRFFCGPYSGRSPALKSHVRGILTNPNNELPLNRVALRTLGAWAGASGDWDPRAAYEAALEEWRPRFAMRGRGAPSAEDLRLLMDCHYLPHSEGPGAERLLAALRDLVSRDPAGWGPEAAATRAVVVRLRDLCASLAGMEDRALFHAMGRRVWELREELDLLDRWMGHQMDPGRRGTPFRPDSHLPGTHRGGFVPRLQRLLEQGSDGVVTAVRGKDAPWAAS